MQVRDFYGCTDCQGSALRLSAILAADKGIGSDVFELPGEEYSAWRVVVHDHGLPSDGSVFTFTPSENPFARKA